MPALSLISMRVINQNLLLIEGCSVADNLFILIRQVTAAGGYNLSGSRITQFRMNGDEADRLSIYLYINTIRNYSIRFSRPNNPESYRILIGFIECRGVVYLKLK
jgi:hypothetical protein